MNVSGAFGSRSRIAAARTLASSAPAISAECSWTNAAAGDTCSADGESWTGAGAATNGRRLDETELAGSGAVPGAIGLCADANSIGAEIAGSSTEATGASPLNAKITPKNVA